MPRTCLALFIAGCVLGVPAQGQESVVALVEADGAERVRVELDYLWWWQRQIRLPPVLTTGPPGSSGALDQPGVRVALGEDKLITRHDHFIGVRGGVSYWIDAEQSAGIEGRAFFLERDSSYFKSISPGNVLLARPFFDVQTGRQSAEIVSGFAPGVGNLSGTFQEFSKIEFFGEEANLLVPLAASPPLRLDLLAGARFLQMRERLDLFAVSKVLPDEATLIGVTDHFRTRNRFYGGQLGVRGEYEAGRWSARFRGEVSAGGNCRIIENRGERVIHTPTSRTQLPFGLLVQPSNSGRFEETSLDVVSELSVQLGFQLTERIRLTAGYTFLHWLNPVRPGDQIDLAVNGGQPIGPARPVVTFADDFFWAQGIDVGVELRW